jgi:hypothetical protein
MSDMPQKDLARERDYITDRLTEISLERSRLLKESEGLKLELADGERLTPERLRATRRRLNYIARRRDELKVERESLKPKREELIKQLAEADPASRR